MEQSVLDGLAIIEENAPAEDTEPKTMVLRNLKEIPRIGYGCGVKSTFRDEVVQFAYENCGIKLFDTCSNAGTEECVKRVS
jgi:diketogulonate reductase-like aldo/keto reductase